jgi:myosin-5
VIEFPKTSRVHFLIYHYAGPVLYNVTGFLEKHQDAFFPDLIHLLETSSTPFVAHLFATSSKGNDHDHVMSSMPTIKMLRQPPRPPLDDQCKYPPSPHRYDKRQSLTRETVGMQFRASLAKLMVHLDTSYVHYIRCFKPNEVKSPFVLDHHIVISQLRCAGVIEAIRIARAAYPIRLRHEDVLSVFRPLSRQHDASNTKNDKSILYDAYPYRATYRLSPREACHALMAETLRLECPRQYQIGRTRVYFQASTFEELHQRQHAFLSATTKVLQRYCRGFLARQHFLRQRVAIITLQVYYDGRIATLSILLSIEFHDGTNLNVSSGGLGELRRT